MNANLSWAPLYADAGGVRAHARSVERVARSCADLAAVGDDTASRVHSETRGHTSRAAATALRKLSAASLRLHDEAERWAQASEEFAAELAQWHRTMDALRSHAQAAGLTLDEAAREVVVPPPDAPAAHVTAFNECVTMRNDAVHSLERALRKLAKASPVADPDTDRDDDKGSKTGGGRTGGRSGGGGSGGGGGGGNGSGVEKGTGGGIRRDEGLSGPGTHGVATLSVPGFGVGATVATLLAGIANRDEHARIRGELRGEGRIVASDDNAAIRWDSETGQWDLTESGRVVREAEQRQAEAAAQAARLADEAATAAIERAEEALLLAQTVAVPEASAMTPPESTGSTVPTDSMTPEQAARIAEAEAAVAEATALSAARDEAFALAESEAREVADLEERIQVLLDAPAPTGEGAARRG